MIDNSLQLMTIRDKTKLISLFDEKKQQNNRISFLDFTSIVKSIGYLAPSVINSYVDSLRKELKAKTSIENEANIMIAQVDYFKYINQLIVENNRYLNEKDSDFRKNHLLYFIEELFELLTWGKESITKKRLMDILNTFAIPIEYDSFFAYVDKKEEIFFEDFCRLFKPSEQKELFKKTFSSGFDMTEKGAKEQFTFPIKTHAQPENV